MNFKFQKLSELGIGEFEHLDGTLFDHLLGTYKILNQWSAPTALKDAGLYHAVYGTEGFDKNLAPPISAIRYHKLSALKPRRLSINIVHVTANIFFLK